MAESIEPMEDDSDLKQATEIPDQNKSKKKRKRKKAKKDDVDCQAMSGVENGNDSEVNADDMIGIPKEKKSKKEILEKTEESPAILCNNNTDGLKKENKEHNHGKKKKKTRPLSLVYDIKELFSNNGKRPKGTHLNFHDIRSLIMLTVHGDKFPLMPTWCRINSWQKILKTIVIMAGYISEDDFRENEDCFKSLKDVFGEPVPVRNEGSDVMVKSTLESFLRYRMPKKLLQEVSLNKEEEGECDPHEPHHYVLTEGQLQKNEYSDWNASAEAHGILTTRVNSKRMLPHADSELLAIDCEMCNIAGNDRALTRVSVVNTKLETVYDSLVKPDEPIVDYLTQFSGITEKMLRDVTTNLKDVQKDLLKLIKPDSILIGHSLEFDMRALKLHHDNIIDTSVLYTDQRGPRYKSSLRFLVKTYLHRDIQISDSGHCSIEDAKACMELVLLKIQNGSTFGNPDGEMESVFQALTRAKKRGALIDSPTIVRQYCHGNHHSVPVASDEQVTSSAKGLVKDVDFMFAHLRDYEDFVKNSNIVDGDLVGKTFQIMSENLSNIVTSIPSDCLVVVSLSSGYIPRDIMTLIKDKEKRKSDEVKQAIRKAKHGLCFVKIT